MKTTKIATGIAFALLALTLVFTSCRKRDKTEAQEPDNEYAGASDNAMAENAANDITTIGSQLSENSGTLTLYKALPGSEPIPDLMIAASCATITAGPITNSMVGTYTVDFGTVGCTGNDNRIRKGKLFFDFTGSATNARRYRMPGFKMKVSSAGYEVDGNAVAITKTVTNTTPSVTTVPPSTVPVSVVGSTAYIPGLNITWHIDANVTVTKSGNAGVVTWNCSRDKELVNTNDNTCYKGQLLPIDWTKAKIKINGTASGTNAKGESYTAKAINLERNFTCSPSGNPNRHPFVAGSVEYKPGDRALRTINYGDGTCDLKAVVVINGQSFEITLP